MASALSADEIALYDRQLRLWGAQAQQQIRSANILLISLRALGTEIAKNLTLAGVGSITIVDNTIVSPQDLGAQFFLREQDVGKSRASAALPRIQELNPRVSITTADLESIDYSTFTCVIACDHDYNTLASINTAARIVHRPFYAAAVHGFYGFIFADLFEHEFIVERERPNVATPTGSESTTRSIIGVTNKREPNGKNVEIVRKRETYCPLQLARIAMLPDDVRGNRRKLKGVPGILPCLRALFEFQNQYSRGPGHNAEDLATFTQLVKTELSGLSLPSETLTADLLRSFIQNLGAEIVPVAAFVGARLSEDVINVLGQREQPIQNWALFDGDSLEGRIYCMYSTPPKQLTAEERAKLEAQLAPSMGAMGMNGGNVMPVMMPQFNPMAVPMMQSMPQAFPQQQPSYQPGLSQKLIMQQTGQAQQSSQQGFQSLPRQDAQRPLENNASIPLDSQASVAQQVSRQEGEQRHNDSQLQSSGCVAPNDGESAGEQTGKLSDESALPSAQVETGREGRQPEQIIAETGQSVGESAELGQPQS